MILKRILFFTCFVFAAFLAGAQNVQIFSENFETGGFTFSLNAAGVGTNSGTNQWIVDNSYTGGGAYPPTMSEDSTYGGTISFAPNSKYLHIYDSGSPYTDCNYNPGAASDQFAYMTNGICTMGLYNVALNFFYLCQGSATAYGELYYSANGGAWIQVGTPQYNGKYKWQYTTVTNPAFDNINNLRFGFRWLNDTQAGRDTSAWAIDDINVVATYDSINHPVTISMSTAASVCQGQFLYAHFKLSDTLCDGTYTLQLSNAVGSFTTPVLSWVDYIYYPQDSGVIPVQIPTSGVVPPGTCYKVRLIRNSPAPYIVSTASACFSVVACPNTITTEQPIVTTDSNAVCAGSVIDVPFASTGTFKSNNVYTAQLSDSSGKFTTTTLIGTFNSSATFDPSVGSPPGTVSGVIPKTVPAGCHYFLRVISSSPKDTGSVWGPFCIQHCDINSNNQKNIQACVSHCDESTATQTDTLSYSINSYTKTHYKSGNNFVVQILSSQTFGLVNSGGLGLVVDTTSGTIKLQIPCAETLASMGIVAGLYYLRVVATNSQYPDSSLGMLVHLTVGIPADSATVYANGSTYCEGDVADFFAIPWNFTSTYNWQYKVNAGGWNAVGPQSALYLDLTGTMGTVTVRVRETSYGCTGPWSSPIVVKVNGPPNVTIKGPLSFCQGDTGNYSVPFQNNTYYKWTIPNSSSLDTANNVAKVIFDSVGTYKVTILAIDSCGTATTTRTVKVTAKPKVLPVTGQSPICKGNTVTLTASGGTKYLWRDGSTTATDNVKPTTDSLFTVKVSNATCTITDSIKIKVLSLPNVNVFPRNKTICNGDSAALNASGANTYSWTPSASLSADTGSSVTAKPAADQTYIVTGQDANGCQDTAKSTVKIYYPNATISPDVTIFQGQSTMLKATGGVSYIWTPSTNLSCDSCPSPTAEPSQTTKYEVVVRDSTGCPLDEFVTVTVEPVCGEVYVPSAFSPNGDGHNDILYARARCAVSFNFRVYDRWGEIVFETGSPDNGWNGIFRGEKMDTAVFVYELDVTTTDGTKVQKKGNVTLVR